MKPKVRRVLFGVAAVVGVGVVAGGGYVAMQVRAFDESMAKVHDVPLPAIHASTDPAVLARGKHLVESVAGCTACHGDDLAGGETIAMGPVGTMTGPNITPAGAPAAYDDGQLARLIRHGVKRDGRSAQFMPAHEVNWMPDDELTAVVSYVRSVPASNKPNGPLQWGPLGKVLDRQGKLEIEVARKVAARPIEFAGEPEPTAAYGRFLAHSCTGCHGERLSGGPIPGTPPSIPTPPNLTPHESGLKGWTYEDFDKLVTKGERKNGKKLDPFMPIASFGRANELEKRALFAYLSTLAPLPFGGR